MPNKFIRLLIQSYPIELKNSAWFHSYYDIQFYDKILFDEYNVEFPLQLSTSVPKRCAEFLAGRYVAHHAVKALTTHSHQIPISDDRSPIWPQGLVGSISHTDCQSIAIVGYEKDYQMLGLDLEHWISLDLALEISPQIINTQENRLLSQTNMAFNQGLTLIFSAKESLFKALYPKVRRFFGFESAQITSIDENTGQFTISLTHDLSSNHLKGWEIRGRYFIKNDTVLTLIYS